MGTVRNRPWPDEAWMSQEQLAEKARNTPQDYPRPPLEWISRTTEREQEEFYRMIDSGINSVAIAHPRPPALPKKPQER
jgi:hypothetical protein